MLDFVLPSFEIGISYVMMTGVLAERTLPIDCQPTF